MNAAAVLDFSPRLSDLHLRLSASVCIGPCLSVFVRVGLRKSRKDAPSLNEDGRGGGQLSLKTEFEVQITLFFRETFRANHLFFPRFSRARQNLP